MGKRTVAVSLGLTYCVVTVAWCFALVKMVALASSGIPVLAHSIIEQAEVAMSGRPVLASPIANNHAARPEPTDCDPTEPARCVFLPIHNDPPPFTIVPVTPTSQAGSTTFPRWAGRPNRGTERAGRR